MEQNITVSVIGRRDGIPRSCLAEIDKTIEMSVHQHRHAIVLGDQLRRPRRDGGCDPKDRSGRRRRDN